MTFSHLPDEVSLTDQHCLLLEAIVLSSTAPFAIFVGFHTAVMPDAAISSQRLHWRLFEGVLTAAFRNYTR